MSWWGVPPASNKTKSHFAPVARTAGLDKGMTRGCIPAPKPINDLRGDTHKRRRHTVEPEPRKDRPEPPDDLHPGARAEWDRITAELEGMSLPSSADRAALTLCVEAHARCDAAKRAAMLQKYDSGVTQVSAAYTIMPQERNVMTKLLREFGLTPAARSRPAVR